MHDILKVPLQRSTSRKKPPCTQRNTFLTQACMGNRECFVDEAEGFTNKEHLGNGKAITLTSIQYEQVWRYVFETDENIDEWKAKYNASGHKNKRKRAGDIHHEFRAWVVNELLRSDDCTSRLAHPANGPNFMAMEYNKYRLNGFVFSSSTHEEKLVGKQNSGISCKALTYFRASAKDKNLVEDEMTYYSIISQILVLNYIDFKETVFYCDCVKMEDKSACIVNPDTNMVMINLMKLKSKDHINDEPFVCAFLNHKQMFYAKSPEDGSWSVMMYSPKRLTTSIDDLEAFHEFQSALDDNPELKKLLDYLDD